MYSGVALSYGMPIPYQQPQPLDIEPTPESPQTPYPNLTTTTQSTLTSKPLNSSDLKYDPSGKLLRNLLLF